MKKVFIIMVMMMSVGVGADSHTTINNSGTGSNFNNSGTGSNFNNSGTNVMLGGGDGAQNTGLGGQNNSFSSSNGNVPKVSLAGVVSWLSGIMNQLIYLIVTASLVAFLYGIFKLSFVDGLKPEAREQARKFMFWGIVSLFVMVSVWGLVSILKVSLFGNGPLIIPQLK